MSYLGWFDGELRPDGWFDAELQKAGWFDTEIIDTATSGAHTLDAESGAFVLTGVVASIVQGYALNVEAGSFTLTGQEAAFTKSHVIDCEAGSFTVTGNDVEFVYSGGEPVEVQVEQTTYPAKKKKKHLGGHYWKPEDLASVEPLVTRLPIPTEPEELPPIAPKPRINRLDTFASAHSALAEIGIHYKQSSIDYSSVINALQAEIQQQQDDDMAIATLVAMLI